MLEIGKFNSLEIVKKVDFGVYLYGDKYDPEILLPSKFVPKNAEVGDKVDVFVYFDSEDRIIATTKKPKAVVGEFAYLKAVSTTRIGAFLDWGLEKDLFVPFREQKQKMVTGNSYLVYVYSDEQTDRLVASSKIDKWLDKTEAEYKAGQEVVCIVINQTTMGVNVIINNLHRGFIFKEDVFQLLKNGQTVNAYIKKIREDGKIDVMLQKLGYDKVDDLTKIILKKLLENDGTLNLNDNSSPQEISRHFSVSKKTFKKALGHLYKKRTIEMTPDGIRLTK